MLPHEQRVINERKELISKADALRSFIFSENYLKIVFDIYDRDLLKQQLECMELYIHILTVRIARF